MLYREELVNPTATGLIKLIKDKRAHLAKIQREEAELIRLQGKLKELQDAVINKPKVEQQLAALEMSLAIAEERDHVPGEQQEQSFWPSEPSGKEREIIVEPTISDIIEEILRKVNRPLVAKDLRTLLEARGKKVTKKTMTSSVYGWIRRGKRFRLFGPGRIGLFEWSPNERD